jgi:hypothetical protein
LAAVATNATSRVQAKRRMYFPPVVEGCLSAASSRHCL